MCGIAGILRIAPIVSPEVAIPDRWLDALDAPLAPRGPDDQGRWRTRTSGPEGSVAHVALLHRRMAIIDLVDGHQPMSLPARPDGAGEIAITFNGCIYNHLALRSELERLGHTFTTHHSDTEALLHGHRQWGRGLAARLEGMYAAGLWDGSERSLILMRDLAGEKPLYFVELKAPQDQTSGSPHALVAFASSAASLYALLRAMQREAGAGDGDTSLGPAIDAALAIDPAAMRQWLAFGWGEGTPWTGIRELKPGQLAWFDTLGRTGRQRISIEAEATRSLGLDARSTRSLIEQAVEQRLEADVPLGCLLSGGLDSGLVAAAAQQALARRGERLKTFTMRMPDARYDETPLAELTARKLGTDHATIDIEHDPAADTQSLIRWLGLPFGDSSLLPTYWLSRAVRERVKVALSGDGGDELFGGYERHTAAIKLERYRSLLRLLGLVQWSARDPKSLWSKLGRLCGAASGAGYADLVAIFPSRLAARLTRDHKSLPSFEVPGMAQWRDFETYLPGDLLRKVDTASMRVALEVRAPLLLRDLIYRAAATPLRTLMPRGRRKALLREAARGVLPDEVLQARKSGFAIPIGDWFRAEGSLRALLHDTLRSPDAFDALGVEIERRVVERMLTEHDARTRDHAQRLFALLSVCIWNRWRRDP